MALHKPRKSIIPPTVSNYNETGDGNPSNFTDENTNFFLRPISYEDIDAAVWREFNRRFKIGGKDLSLILLDADVASLFHQTPEQVDKVKKYVSLPYFTMWRSNTSPLFRVSPSYKPIVYAIPRQKPQGVVFEEYFCPPPRMQKLTYSFKFASTYRENVNTFEERMDDYFKNKRNVIIMDGERFEIMPADADRRGELEMADREGREVAQSLYILTYEMIVVCYIRNLSEVQKRERPNTLTFQIVERAGRELTIINQTETRLLE